jgi:hypothetical protein
MNVTVRVVRELEAEIVSGVARKHEIGQRDNQVAALRIDLFEREKAQVITMLLCADAIELQGLADGTRNGEKNESGGEKEA